MLSYLYKNWACICLILAIYVSFVLWSSLSSIGWLVFLIWLQFPVYLLHEFEEHAYPGHFQEVFNKEIFGVMGRSFPLNPCNIFWINILGVWILFPLFAYLGQNVDLKYGLFLPIFGMFNATTHIILFLVKRRYNPGLGASLFLNYPTGIYTLLIASSLGVLEWSTILFGLLLAFLIHIAIAVYVVGRFRLEGRS